jgi:hypothetical protein
VQLLYTILFPAATKTGEELDTFVNVDHEFFIIIFWRCGEPPIFADSSPPSMHNFFAHIDALPKFFAVTIVKKRALPNAIPLL